MMFSSSWHAWTWLSRLGEAQILLPLSLAAVLWLWLAAGEGRLALRWIMSLAVAASVTTASKLAFIGWGLGSAAWDFTGFSGHAMFAAATLPMLAWVALLGRPRAWRRAGVAFGFGLAALIAYSRLPVHAHSPSEALAGFLLGAAASWVTLRGLPGVRLRVPLWLPAALAAGLMLMPTLAPRSRTHDWVTEISLQLSGRAQPFHRHDMQRHARPAEPVKANSVQAPLGL